MYKDELIRLHARLSDIKDYFEASNPELRFSDYYALKIDPSQIHKSKLEHKYAIFVLGAEIADIITDKEFTGPARISVLMKDLAEKAQNEIGYIT